METAAESETTEIAEDLLKYFVDVGAKVNILTLQLAPH